MSVDNISVSLRAWHQTGKRVPATAFIEKLTIKPSDPVKKAKGPGVPRVELLSLAVADYSGAGEPTEAFVAALKEALLKAAKWLAKQSPEVFQALRGAGFVTDVFIGAWIDSDQLDLDLPPEFLAECGRHGLTISLITND